ncbi:hypothetical protein PACTADRAFT_74709 [Pachysolen tannophilus NRRL Y-2460]|uniref:Uncharacterized protein n=1 Tax=Pachysolen tannophilus NRRL Y-2460 TaxID=669874 RepID=A0A1E4TZI4_PACTA|nr:hypothetical protein PACTADRAFT_74709 [Pachysolen tannophilus NRRL Y-2460]
MSGILNHNNDSIVSLMKPTLYQIYGNDEVDLDNENNDIYVNLNENINRHNINADNEGYFLVNRHLKKNEKRPLLQKIIITMLKLLVLAIMGNLYFKLLESINYNDEGKSTKLPNLNDFKILFLFSHFLGKFNLINFKNEKFGVALNCSLEGIALGLIQPVVLDNLLKLVFEKKQNKTNSTLHIKIPTGTVSAETVISEAENLSSGNLKVEKKLSKNNNSISNSKNLASFINKNYETILRSTVAVIGISYGLKKIEWESSLQASISWSLLNPCLWLLLDGTWYGFLSNSFVSCTMMVLGLVFGDTNKNLVDLFDLEELSKILWLGSFSFIGMLIFSKVGRYLFGRD